MQSISRSMISGGSGVRRISRWHPYHPQPVATPSTSSSLGTEDSANHAPLFLSTRCTVSSAVYAPSPITSLAARDFTPIIADSGEASDPPSSLSRVLTPQDRATYARCLVDRAVNILTQKWMQVAYSPFPQPLSFPKEPRVAAPANSSHSTFSAATQPDLLTPRYPYQSTAEHMPLRQFMHEVLRRSRTSCTSLQTALCYVEAVAVKLPTLVRDEMLRIEQHNVSTIIDEVTVTEPDSAKESIRDEAAPAIGAAAAPTDTVLGHPTSSPSMPSPLLCPRRTFLASLLLASKFLQDRSYSNKAWGKLTGLAPREVGRCERALSDALEWRLWVGKGQETLFPTDFMDDGGPVVPSDAVYQQESEPPAASATTLPIIPSLAPQVMGSSRIRKTRTEAIIQPPRPTQLRRLGPASTWAPSRFASHIASSSTHPSCTPRTRTATWVSTLSDATTLPAGFPTPLSEPPLSQFLGNESTFVETASQSSLSPPGSLVYTQSSAASFASFAEVATPPDALANLDAASRIPTSEGAKGMAFSPNVMLLHDGIAGIGDWQ